MFSWESSSWTNLFKISIFRVFLQDRGRFLASFYNWWLAELASAIKSERWVDGWCCPVQVAGERKRSTVTTRSRFMVAINNKLKEREKEKAYNEEQEEQVTRARGHLNHWERERERGISRGHVTLPSQGQENVIKWRWPVMEAVRREITSTSWNFRKE